MSVHTYTVGYPRHAVKEATTSYTEHGVRLTDWVAFCGEAGQRVGPSPFNTAFYALKGEMCKACFPEGHRTYLPDTILKTV